MCVSVAEYPCIRKTRAELVVWLFTWVRGNGFTLLYISERRTWMSSSSWRFHRPACQKTTLMNAACHWVIRQSRSSLLLHDFSYTSPRTEYAILWPRFIQVSYFHQHNVRSQYRNWSYHKHTSNNLTDSGTYFASAALADWQMQEKQWTKGQ